MKRIYLACPYSNMEKEAFDIVNRLTVHLINKGYVVFSPISHSHCLASYGKLPTTWDFWKQQDIPFIEWSEEVWVTDLGQDKIQNSKGVQAEILIAKNTGKAIRYICPITYEVSDKPIHL